MVLPANVTGGDPGHIGDHEEIHAALNNGIATPWAITPPDVVSPYGTVVDGPGTNLITNPSFEVDVAGWSVPAGNGSFTRESGGVVGDSFARLRFPTDSTAWASLTSPVLSPTTAGLAYTISFWWWAVAATNDFRMIIRWRDAANATIADTTWYLGGTSSAWARIERTATAPANAVSALVILYNATGTSTVAGDYYLDGFQFEQADKSSSYLDGSLGPGYAWSGTPHASTSTRVGGLHVLDASGKLYAPGIVHESWRIPTFQNGWVEYDSNYPVRYRKENGRVWVKGLAKSGTIGTAIFTFPIGYRPTANARYFVTRGHTGSAFVTNYLYVHADGSLIIQSGTNVECSLDGISFDVETT